MRKIRHLFTYQITSRFMNIRKNFMYWFDSRKRFMFFRYIVCKQERFDFLVSMPDAYDQGNTMLVMGFDLVKKKLFCQFEFSEENLPPIKFARQRENEGLENMPELNSRAH